MIQIEIDGQAQAQMAPRGVIMPPLPPSLRQRHSVRMYSPTAVRKWQTTARVLAIEQMKGLNPISGPLEVIIWVHLVPPASMSHKKRLMALNGSLHPTTRPDLDNYSKAVLDAFNGVCWLDDSQIVALHVYKRFSEKPRIVIKVEPLERTTGELFKRPEV